MEASIQQLSHVKNKINEQRRKLFLRRFLSNKLAVTGSIIIIIATLFTTFGPMISSYTPYEMEPANRLQAPSSEHIMGTDNFGRDLFARVAYGARASMGVGISVALITSFLLLSPDI